MAKRSPADRALAERLQAWSQGERLASGSGLFHALAERQDLSFLPFVTACLEDWIDAGQRQRAAWAMSVLGAWCQHPEAVIPLLQASAHRKAWVRDDALTQLIAAARKQAESVLELSLKALSAVPLPKAQRRALLRARLSQALESDLAISGAVLEACAPLHPDLATLLFIDPSGQIVDLPEACRAGHTRLAHGTDLPEDRRGGGRELLPQRSVRPVPLSPEEQAMRALVLDRSTSPTTLFRCLQKAGWQSGDPAVEDGRVTEHHKTFGPESIQATLCHTALNPRLPRGRGDSVLYENPDEVAVHTLAFRRPGGPLRLGEVPLRCVSDALSQLSPLLGADFLAKRARARTGRQVIRRRKR